MLRHQHKSWLEKCFMRTKSLNINSAQLSIILDLCIFLAETKKKKLFFFSLEVGQNMSVWCFSSEDVHQCEWSYCSHTGAPSCQNKHETLLHHPPQCFMCNLNSISRRGAAGGGGPFLQLGSEEVGTLPQITKNERKTQKSCTLALLQTPREAKRTRRQRSLFAFSNLFSKNTKQGK